MSNGPAADGERISDQRSMAAPRHCLRTHDGRRSAPTLRHERLEGSEKRLGLHIVGIAAEACVLPAGIDGIFLGPSQPAQVRLVHIRDVRNFQMLGQRIRIKLRVVAGTRNRSHVDEAPDAMGLQQRQEFVDGFRGMADAPELSIHWTLSHRGCVVPNPPDLYQSHRVCATFREARCTPHSGGILRGSTSSSLSRPLPACSVL